MTNLDLKVVKSSKERIEEIVLGDFRFQLHDEFEFGDGGVIIGLKDNAAIRKSYEEMGFIEEHMLFEGADNGEEYSINDVACGVDVRDGNEGYTIHFGIDGQELFEM